MLQPLFIPIIFPHHSDDSSGPGTAPFGHAGFVLVDGSGHATYYEFGLYNDGEIGLVTNNPNGNFRSVELGDITEVDGQITPESLRSILDGLTTGSNPLYQIDTGMLFASPFPISDEQALKLSVIIGDEEFGPLGNYTIDPLATNDCLSFVYQSAQSKDLI